MKKGWTEVALGEVLKTVDRTEAVEPDSSYRLLGVRLEGRGAFHRETKLGSEISAKYLNRVESGDFIYSRLYAWKGAFSLVRDDLDQCYVSNEFPLFRPINETDLDLRFLRCWFQLSRVWKIVEADCQGSTPTTRNRYNEQFFLNLRAPLPPLSEQQRIVTHLDAIEERLNRIQKLREESDKELLAALRSAFHKIEAESEWLPMEEVAPLVRREVEIDIDTSYTEFGIKSFYKGIFLRRKMRGDAYDWQKLFWLKEGDVVFSNIMAWEKAIGLALAENDGWVGNHRMLTCEPIREKVLPCWLYSYFTTSKGFAAIEKASPGTAARNKTLKAGSLASIEVPVPKMEDQKHFQRLFDLRRAATQSRESFEDKYDALIPSLLDRIFNQQ
ncbi:MAG: restriction endonuclease subunit S [Verrucomicrobiota bacterium JB025]|nr:restriction endonuclease subunit S [Verrucomicrobiota bacterium JB025]